MSSGSIPLEKNALQCFVRQFAFNTACKIVIVIRSLDEGAKLLRNMQYIMSSRLYRVFLFTSIHCLFTYFLSNKLKQSTAGTHPGETGDNVRSRVEVDPERELDCAITQLPSLAERTAPPWDQVKKLIPVMRCRVQVSSLLDHYVSLSLFRF